MVREGSCEEVTFELSPQAGVSHRRTRGEAFREERSIIKAKKDLEAG